MRHYECECQACHVRQQFVLEEPYPEYGDQFLHYCKHCQADSTFVRVLTRRTLSAIRREQAEEHLRTAIQEECKKRGFDCRFLMESVIVTTQVSTWSFNYHDSVKVLRHENRRPVRDDMGGFVKTHEQFRKKAGWLEILDYIEQHDKWRMEHTDNHGSGEPGYREP